MKRMMKVRMAEHLLMRFRSRGEAPTLARLLLAASLGSLLAISPVADDNIYTNSISGKWEVPTNWSLGAPTTNNSIFITNAGTKTVTIDGIASTNFPGTMTVTNLTIGAASGALTIDNSLFEGGT